MKKIRVLQIIEGFNLGGAEKKLFELVLHMDYRKFQTTICSLGLGDTIQEQFQALEAHGIRVVVLSRNRRLDIRLIFRLIRLIREQKTDVIMTTLFYADVIGAIVGKLTGVKAIYSWETISAPEWLVWRRLIIYRAIVRFFTRIISVSEATAKWLTEKRGVPASKVIVIPYGVDLNKFIPRKNEDLKKELNIPENHYIVGQVSRLHPQKGHIYLVKAAEKIVKSHPNVSFVLVGDGELKVSLQKSIKQKGLENYFHLLGFRQDVHEILQAFDIFVLPSLYEGLPNVILEAMAAGKPVVATPVDGSKELICHKRTGFLIAPHSSLELADAIIKLIDNPKLIHDFGNRGRKRVKDRFSLIGQIENFQDLYENCYIQSE